LFRIYSIIYSIFMKILDSLLLAASIGFLIIWADQIIRLKHSLGDTYFILMLSVVCILGLQVIRKNRTANPLPETDKKKKKK
jgi:hypothetical protein